MNSDYEQLIRLASFDWLRLQMKVYGDVLNYTLLKNGFIFQGKQIKLVGQTGIWKPQQCEYPISILTSVRGNYQDALNIDNYIVYSYRGSDPNHHNNVGLRNVMKHQLPLIYFLGIAKGRYVPIFPAYIHHDDPKNLRILLQVDNRKSKVHNEFQDGALDPVRDYITVEVKRRIHQDRFRENVLTAYRCRCAFCSIRHTPLLDAAHIIPDSDPDGQPVVSNGLSLCKIHHAAFDSNIMGITPDYLIKVNEKVLDEKDGPMLQHGIKELNDTKMIIPTRIEWRPNRDNLSKRFEEFNKIV